MPPKRKQETVNLSVSAASPPKKILRSKQPQDSEFVIPAVAPPKRILRSKQPHDSLETAIPAVAAPKRNRGKRKQPQEKAAMPTDSAASSPRRNCAKQPETTIVPAPSTLPESMMSLTHDQAQMLVRQLITHFDMPKRVLDSGVSFSQIKYAEVAPRVGLDRFKRLKDIPTFEMSRSRIPTPLFKAIIIGLDTMTLQYGLPDDHQNEEARSRFFSPVFNHLVKQFTFMLRNEPAIIHGRNGTRGRIEYFFKAFGAVAILCVEMLEVGNVEERLDAIAQVIAECDRCEAKNGDDGYLLPVLGILSDGLTFEFFKFTRDRLRSQSLFFRGCFLGDPVTLRRGLMLPDTRTMDFLPFILQLRHVCETIFDLMLNAYISALKAYRDQSASESRHEGKKRPTSDAWDQALKLANNAVATLREADNQRAKGDIDSADTTALEGFRLLNESTGTVSTAYESKLFMTGWDEDEVRKA